MTIDLHTVLVLIKAFCGIATVVIGILAARHARKNGL